MNPAKFSLPPDASEMAGTPGAAPVLTRDRTISVADFAAILTELRHSGVKPNPAVISRALQQKGFATSRSIPDESSRPPDDKIVHLSKATAFPQQDTFAALDRQYESELEQTRREAATLQQELIEYREALPDLLRREAALLHQLELAAGKLLSREQAETEPTDAEALLQEALGRETILKNRLADLEVETAKKDSLAEELADQRERIAHHLQREQELSTQLEEASLRALLADKLEDELSELRITLADFRDRESEWATLEQRELESRRLAESLSQKVNDSELALEDSQRRQDQLEQELAGLHDQFHEASQAGMAALQSKLTETTQALGDARREVQEQDAQLQRLRERTHEAESAIAEAGHREAELLGRMEAAAQRASQLEEQLTTHLHAIDWSREHAGRLHDGLVQTLDSVSRLLPENAAPSTFSNEGFPATGSDIPAALAEPFHALEAVLTNLRSEVARAEEYQEFLKAELSKSRQEPGPSPAGDLEIHLESSALGKYLAEVIESELHRQSLALDELTRREAELRGQLEKAKPRSGRAQSIEGELSGQTTFREDMTHRKAALARLLEETIANLRAQQAQTAESLQKVEEA